MGRIQGIAEPLRHTEIMRKSDQYQRECQKAIGFQPHECLQRIAQPGRQNGKIDGNPEKGFSKFVTGAPEQEEGNHDRGNTGAGIPHRVKQNKQGDPFPAIVRVQNRRQGNGNRRSPDLAQVFLFSDAPQGTKAQEQRQENIRFLQ